MPAQIGQKPESDFSNPLGLLSDCHRRIERFLAVLVTISERRKGSELPAEERTALDTALTYFRNSAPKHTSDEEDSLFPRLRASATAVECMQRLESDHQAANEDHEIVNSLGTLWLTHGKLPSDQAVKLGAALTRLSNLYAKHIAVEDTELFPLAAKVLPEKELAAVGREMADRRGIRTA
ncbi:MAG TPA: hemerythrin domain-containing protein [Bryobacteraceae bacterium]|nr:hemerythrin domain-containing protein [Bryobacteraceae bacterium]